MLSRQLNKRIVVLVVVVVIIKLSLNILLTTVSYWKSFLSIKMKLASSKPLIKHYANSMNIE